MHEVLVNRLGGLSLPRKSVVRLTDRPDMTLDVYRGRKTTIQLKTPNEVSSELVVIFPIIGKKNNQTSGSPMLIEKSLPEGKRIMGLPSFRHRVGISRSASVTHDRFSLTLRR